LLLALGFLLLAGITCAAHIWCLWDGSVLDDHWHQKGLREHGWSYAELLHTLVIEPADWVHLWWQEKTVRWEYLRPVFILCMKLVYVVIGGGDPLALHAFSVLLHGIAALLVWRLGWLLTRSLGWSLAAACVYVVYPHASVTVAWPSSQNAVLQTVLLLAAILCYLRASGLEARLALGARGGQDVTTTPVRRGPLIACLGFWVVALFTRENAIMLPAILLAFDLAFGGIRHLRGRWPAFAVMALLGVAFIALRLATIRHGMPDVYVRRADGDLPEYAVWFCVKFLHYVCTSVWLAPMAVGPTGRFNPLVEAPGDVALMLGIVAMQFGAYAAAARRARGWWIWPLWIGLSVAPVTPVVATPHSGYMCGVAFALGLALAATAPRTARWRGVARGVLVFYFVTMSVFTMWNRWQWTGMIGAERYAAEAIAARPPAPQTQHVFLINLPFVNIYLKPHLVELLGPAHEGVQHHVLTFAPDAVMIEQRSVVEQLDERTLAVSIEGQPYFSRLLGRFLINGFRGPGRLEAGQRIETPEFDVQIAEADAEGVRRILFTFARPLADPGYCFYVSTTDCGAAKLRFASAAELAAADDAARGAAPPTGALAADGVERAEIDLARAAFDAGRADFRIAGALLASDSAATRAAAWAALRPPIVATLSGLASPLQSELDLNVAPPPASVAGLRSWWRLHVGDEQLRTCWVERDRFAHLVKMREEVPHARMWVSYVIRTDLYLTGRPFPGPR